MTPEAPDHVPKTGTLRRIRGSRQPPAVSPTPIPWLMLLLVGIYLVAVAAVAIQGAQPIVDEWIYIDAARQFAESGEIHVAPISFATSIFEAVYGGAVVWAFSDSVAALVISTGVLGACGGIALWDLLRRSRVDPGLNELVVGTFLFGAVFFGLSTTYMTDVHALSLVVIAASLYSRGIDDGSPRPWWLVAGSLAASLAYLSRPGSMAVLAGVGVVALRRRNLIALSWGVALPLITFGGHVVGQAAGVVPRLRQDILERLAFPAWAVLMESALVLIICVGIWLIPIGPLIGDSIVNSERKSGSRALAASALALILVVLFSLGVPIVGHWMNRTGSFPIDGSTVGSRLPILAWPFYVIILMVAIALAISALAGALTSHVTPRLRSAEIALWAGAGTSVLLVLFTQVARWGQVIDRYLVVVLPAVLLSVTVRWLNEKPLRFARSSWITLGVIAALSILMANDGMRMQRAIFETADAAVSQGASPSEIDGGAAWTGLHFGLTLEPEDALPTNGRNWWRNLFAPGLDPRYVVTINSIADECVVRSTDVRTFVGLANRVDLVDTAC